MAANSIASSVNAIAPLTVSSTTAPQGRRIVIQVPTAVIAALAMSDVSSRKPVAATSPTAAAFARMRRDSDPFGGTSVFQIAFSADWISPKVPLAVRSRSPTPIAPASAPDPTSLAPRIAASTALAASGPSNPRSCDCTAPRTASSPNTAPAIVIATTSNGESENRVKYAIDAARLRHSSAMKPSAMSIRTARRRRSVIGLCHEALSLQRRARAPGCGCARKRQAATAVPTPPALASHRGRGMLRPPLATPAGATA